MHKSCRNLLLKSSNFSNRLFQGWDWWIFPSWLFCWWSCKYFENLVKFAGSCLSLHHHFVHAIDKYRIQWCYLKNFHTLLYFTPEFRSKHHFEISKKVANTMADIPSFRLCRLKKYPQVPKSPVLYLKYQYFDKPAQRRCRSEI